MLMVVKHHMADSRPSQVVAVCPARFKSRILQGFLQPPGVMPRRTKSKQLVDNLKHHVPKLRAQNLISDSAATYLLQFAEGSLPQLPRPASYSFLDYRWGEHDDCERPDVQYDGESLGVEKPVRVVRLRNLGGPAREEDEGDAAELGPLVLAERE